MVTTKTSANVTLFDRLQTGKNKGAEWTTQDVADLYRIGDQLTQFGFPVSVHTGQTDEGDPWAVFERTGTSEVVVHVARIDSELLIVDVVRDRTHRGGDFRSLANELLAEAPLTLPRAENRGNVVLHPRMVMTAFVAAAFVLAEFTDPSTAEAAILEDFSELDPSEDQEAMTEPSMVGGHYCYEKFFGRDNMIGGYSAQTIGVGALAAGLAVLSSHLTLDSVHETSNDVADTGSDTDNLFNSQTYVPTSTALYIKEDHLFENTLFDVLSVEQSQLRKATVSAKVEVNENVTVHQLIEVKDWDTVTTSTLSPAVTLVPSLEEDLIASPASIAMYSQQDLYLSVAQEDQPAVNPTASATESSTRSGVAPAMDATEVLSDVLESVTILEKAQLSKLPIDGDNNGAIVVTISDLPDKVADETDLIDSSTVPSSETVLEGDVQSAEFETYQLLSDLSQNVHLVSDVENILVYAGGDVEVSGFTLGRDSIVFIDGISGSQMLDSVEIVSSDVVLMGQGGSVTLQDAITIPA